MSAIDEKRFSALGREWTARFDFNAMCAVEQRGEGRAFLAIVAPMLSQLDAADRDDPARQIAAARAIRMSDIRLLFHQSLLGAQPGLGEAEAGELIAAIGLGAAMGIVAWAVTRALGEADADGESDQGGGAAGAENPPPQRTRARPAG